MAIHKNILEWQAAHPKDSRNDK